MPLYDFHCHKCGTFEVILKGEEFSEKIVCGCGEIASLTWIKPPGMAIVDAQRTEQVLKKRAADHSRKHARDSIDRVRSGEDVGRGGLSRPDVQTQIFRNKGKK